MESALLAPRSDFSAPACPATKLGMFQALSYSLKCPEDVKSSGLPSRLSHDDIIPQRSWVQHQDGSSASLSAISLGPRGVPGHGKYACASHEEKGHGLLLTSAGRCAQVSKKAPHLAFHTLGGSRPGLWTCPCRWDRSPEGWALHIHHRLFRVVNARRRNKYGPT